MNWYLFSFDIDTKRKNPTDYDDVYRALCALINEGFELLETKLRTTFILKHEKGMYKRLLKFPPTVLAPSDKWILSRIPVDSNGVPYISDKGTTFDCSKWKED